MKDSRKKRRIEFAASVVLPLVGLLLLLAEHTGAIDWLRGLDKVEQVADRFDRSYSTDASRRVYPEDAAWKPTIALIEKYSKVKWHAGRQPQEIARLQAKLSSQDEDGYEWTSPSTPIVVLYRRWPTTPGLSIPKDDVEMIGSIGELHSWIDRSKSEIHFLINDVFLAVMAVTLSYWLWRVNHSHPQKP
jgi:hypothetical protein